MLLAGPPAWDALGSAHLPARRDPAVARRARGGGAVLPPGPPRWTRPRAGNVVAALGAGAYRPCSASDPTGARRSAGSDRSITPAAGALVRRIRSVAFPGLPRRVPVRHRAGNVGDVAPVPWVETLGSGRVTTRMPGRVSSGRKLCASRRLRATILQTFPIYENIAKIPIQEDGGDRRSDDQR